MTLSRHQPFPPARTVLLAAVFATAVLLGVSSLIAWAMSPLVRYLWAHENGAMSWFGIVINLVGHLATIAVTVLLYRRSAGHRAEMLRIALAFLFGYMALVFFMSIYSAAGARATLFMTKGGTIEMQWPMILIGIVVPLAVGAVLFVYAGRPHRN